MIIGSGVLPRGQSSSAEFEEVMRRSSMTIGEKTVSVPFEKVKDPTVEGFVLGKLFTPFFLI